MRMCRISSLMLLSRFIPPSLSPTASPSLFSTSSADIYTVWWCVSLVTQPCPTLCDSIDCSPSGFSVHGILQARIPEWVVMPFSKGFSQPRDPTQVSPIASGFFTVWNHKILEWVVYPFLRASFQSRNQTGVSCIAGGFFISWATREAHIYTTMCEIDG